MSAAAPALAERLRHGTRRAHRALDHHPVLAPLVQPTLLRADYARALRALLPPHEALERACEAALQARGLHAWCAPRREALRADLARLDDVPEPAAPAPSRGPSRPRARAPESLDDDAQLAGALYVLEGSRLGAVVIARRVRASLGADAPLAYFGQAERDSAERWERYWALAARWCGDEPAMARAVTAACAAFDRYRAALDAHAARTAHAPPD